MSAADCFWWEDPLPIQGPVGDDRCEQCWRPAYGSFPGHVLCREHFLDHQRQVIAAITARAKQGAA